MVNNGTAYLLCLLWFLGLGGIHRFYCGKVGSGIIYLFTWGLFGFGQLIDLALIPGMVDERNLRYLALRGGNQSNNQNTTQTVVVNLGGQVSGQIPGQVYPQNGLQLPTQQPTPQPLPVSGSTQNDTVTLLRLAQNKDGCISLADAVIETGKPASEVKTILESICADGLMEITNHPTTGAVIYKLL